MGVSPLLLFMDMDTLVYTHYCISIGCWCVPTLVIGCNLTRHIDTTLTLSAAHLTNEMAQHSETKTITVTRRCAHDRPRTAEHGSPKTPELISRPTCLEEHCLAKTLSHSLNIKVSISCQQSKLLVWKANRTAIQKLRWDRPSSI